MNRKPPLGIKSYKGTATLEYGTEWVIAICDGDIVEYYNWLLKRHRGVVVSTPRNGAHISIVRGQEEDKVTKRIFQHARVDLSIEFYYSNDIHVNSRGWCWIPVWGKVLNDIRTECLMPFEPRVPFHLTLGRNRIFL